MRSKLAILALPLLLVLGGCASGAASSAPAAPKVPAPVPMVQQVGSDTLSLVTNPSPPASAQPLALTLTITSAGVPVKGETVRITSNMLAMNMGSSVIPLRERAPGVYGGQTQFSMSGGWALAVKATGPQSIAAVFDVNSQ